MSDRASLEKVEQFRRQQLREHGLEDAPAHHFRRLEERPLLPGQRDRVTILFGGLTRRHEQLIQAGMEGLGYRVQVIPTPTRYDCQTGKEYSNPGQCNPSYFTVGSLVNHLKRLRDQEGHSPDEIVDRYVYMTAGSCGPCRFGMYESEYRLAAHNAGFPGFRVLVFQQMGGLKQSRGDSPVEFKIPFFLSLLNGIFLGDVLNMVAHQIRPYEVVPGSTNAAMEECLEICCRHLHDKSYDVRPTWKARLLSLITAGYDACDVAMFLDQLGGDWYTGALRRCVDVLNRRVEVDFTRPKPKVKIVGEFWAQTTEGDGNFRMFEFLEQENAEVVAEPVATWIDYLLHQAMLGRQTRRGLPADMDLHKRETLGERIDRLRTHYKKMILMHLSGWMIRREYDRLRGALRGVVAPLPRQSELCELARPYFNPQSAGGEGHLEIAKTIYYSKKRLCHMVLSLKPFGCMPSTQSDGAQAAVIADYPEAIFLPIETSAEGEVNAYSRVQMALGEAKLRCKAEFNEALARAGVSLEQVRAYVAAHPQLRQPFQDLPACEGFPSRAAGFVLHVATLMARDESWRGAQARLQSDNATAADPAAAGQAA